MASSPPPPPTPTSPPSASNSENSATRSPPSMPPKVDDGDPKSSAPQVLDEMPHLTHFQILDSEENMDKYKKYEADYTRRLMAKYFSKQNLYGGNIFDEKMTIDDEIILSSKWPCTRSFADPMNGFEEQSNVGSTSET
ncbi:inactive protein tyrosine kinase pTKL isoform X1 [Ricinus communis]|uniref:Uncharacterized protein n=1 Tax=Ricinus communis TaxID=3988 RepID=B9RLH0_RICCO|nr:inactive protein tyrosine kinase pTKL isoform X1 [Ricinus communis]XP_048229418.1 inactive protein tyrosine kinase pTKL isoform X1 [Ricinus communis]EEF47695.1 conserved hypothetical protein [Ricinus communis]|eukprot:XP_002514589.1 uncharacterized protein LOC8264665 isoform X1 [Ricinus communis]